MKSTYGRRSVVYSTVKTSTCQASLIDTDVGPAQRYEQIFIPVTNPVQAFGSCRSTSSAHFHPSATSVCCQLNGQGPRRDAAFNLHDARS